MTTTAVPPREGMMAVVRNRRALITGVQPFAADELGRLHLVEVEYTDGVGAERDLVLWKVEPGTDVLEPAALPHVEATAPMEPREFDARERLSLCCVLDAVIAAFHGLSRDDLGWVLRDCDHPKERLSDKSFCRGLDPKGFWRVDKSKGPELRHPILTLVGFDALGTLTSQHGGDRDAGIAAFAALNGGEGWMAPKTPGSPTTDSGTTTAPTRHSPSRAGSVRAFSIGSSRRHPTRDGPSASGTRARSSATPSLSGGSTRGCQEPPRPPLPRHPRRQCRQRVPQYPRAARERCSSRRRLRC